MHTKFFDIAFESIDIIFYAFLLQRRGSGLISDKSWLTLSPLFQISNCICQLPGEPLSCQNLHFYFLKSTLQFIKRNLNSDDIQLPLQLFFEGISSDLVSESLLLESLFEIFQDTVDLIEMKNFSLLSKFLILLAQFIDESIPDMKIESMSFLNLTHSCELHLSILQFCIKFVEKIVSWLPIDRDVIVAHEVLGSALWRSHEEARNFNSNLAEREDVAKRLNIPLYIDQFILLKQECFALYVSFNVWNTLAKSLGKSLSDAEAFDFALERIDRLASYIFDIVSCMIRDENFLLTAKALTGYLKISQNIFETLDRDELDDEIRLTSTLFKTFLRKLSMKTFDFLQIKPAILNQIHSFSYRCPVEHLSGREGLKELETTSEQFNAAIIRFMRNFQKKYVTI